MNKRNVIKCPNCGCEYLGAEIFYPKYFFGEPYNIVKDEKGAILGYNGTDMDTIETFECEKCGQKFSVEASINFKTEAYSDIFDEEDDDFFEKVDK